MTKADLHIHTDFSYDGISSPEQVVDSAIKKGIRCICITDHQETKGAFRALKYSFDKNILVVPGIEVSAKAGDVVGINVKKKIPAGLSVKETIKEIRKQGGLAVMVHPFDIMPFGLQGGKETLKRVDFDALEVFNAGCILKRSTKKALDFALKKDLAFTAGSDAHRARYVGRGYLEFKENISSAKELINLIKGKKGSFKGRPLNLAEVFWNCTGANIF